MANNHPTVEIACAQCGKAAIRFATNGTVPLYCGRVCKLRAYRAAHPERTASYRAKEARNAKIADLARIRVVVLRNRPPPPEVEPRFCGCGAELGKWLHRYPPCQQARAKAQKKKARKNCPSRRAAKARRKALQRGRLDGAEKFDPIEVLARDGWRCYICGISTPKRLRGSYDNRAPELDHIVPLALGGQHTRQNTACACRRCNIDKGSRPLGQLRLVA